jgi:ribosomal protein S18 acetylase RimI-like enzyme
MEEEYTVGLGRVVGDGAISFLLTNIVVRPSHQRRGIGSLIVKTLCSCVEALPYKNIVLEVVPLPEFGIVLDVSVSKLHEMPRLEW